MKLTPKQAEILRVIEEEIARTGNSPTYRDIARICGYDAVGTVQDHVKALIKKGHLQKSEGIARGLRPTHPLIAHPQRNETTREIPILGTIPAGSPAQLLEEVPHFENALGWVSVPARWKGALFALRVTGDSMINAGILEDDIVIVQCQPDAETGEIVVASIDGEATVKKLNKKKNQVQLLAANPNYSPILFYPRLDERKIEIIGKVISVQRFYI